MSDLEENIETAELPSSGDAGGDVAVKKPISRKSAWRVAALMALVLSVSSFADAFAGLKSTYLLKEVLGLSAGAMATVSIITDFPDYLRPFMGSLADLVPLFGYHRRSYYLLGWVISIAGSLALAFLHHYTYWTVVIASTVGGAGASMVMIMADAVMVKVGGATGTIPQIQSVQQFMGPALFVAGLATLQGYVTEHWSYHACFMASALTTFCALPSVLLIDEKRVNVKRHHTETEEEHRLRLEHKSEERREIVGELKKAARSIELWAVVGYVFYLIFTPSVNFAQFMYSTNHLNFSAQFMGDLGAPGNWGTIAGIVLFGAAARWVSVRTIVWSAWALDCVSYPVNYFYNGHLSAIITSFIGGLLGILYNLCLYTIAARACPPKIEATVYGLVISTISVAGNLSEKVGDSIFDKLGGEHLNTIVYAWHTSLIIGFLVTIPACLFIPFLPKWTRSKEPLKPRLDADLAAA